MKLQMYIKTIVALIFVAGSLSCTQKSGSQTSPVAKEVAQPQTVESTNPVIVELKQDPQNRSIIERITAKPKEEETAVTYPKPVKIQKYASISKKRQMVSSWRGWRSEGIFRLCRY